MESLAGETKTLVERTQPFAAPNVGLAFAPHVKIPARDPNAVVWEIEGLPMFAGELGELLEDFRGTAEMLAAPHEWLKDRLGLLLTQGVTRYEFSDELKRKPGYPLLVRLEDVLQQGKTEAARALEDFMTYHVMASYALWVIDKNISEEALRALRESRAANSPTD